jgi:hypothetical protein
MPVTITITGNTASDALAELQDLARTTEAPQVVPGLALHNVDKAKVKTQLLFTPTVVENVTQSLDNQPLPFPPAAEAEPPLPFPPAAEAEPLLPFPTVVASGPVDTRGYPWDGRIHNSGKTKMANGNWKNRRGVDKALVAQVEAELAAATGAAPAPAAPAPAAPAPAAPAPASPAPAAPAPAAPAPAAPAPAAAKGDYTRTAAKMSNLIGAGVLDIDTAMAMIAEHGDGAKSLPEMVGNDAALAKMEAALDLVKA